MLLQLKPAFGGDAVLTLLDLGVIELLHPTALQAHQMVVVGARIELKNRLAGLEIAALQKSRLLELGEHAINRGQTDVLLHGQQFPVHVLGTEVTMRPLLEDLQNLQSGQGCLQPGIFQFAHGRSHGSPHGNDGRVVALIISVLHAAALPADLGRSPWESSTMRLIVLCSVLASLAAAGCTASNPNSSGMFSPYRIDIPQGNYVTLEMLDQIKPGMSRDQVRYALGAPLLKHTFRDDRWDYVFRYQHANGAVDLRRVAIRFKDEQVVEIVQPDALPQRDDQTDPALPGIRRPQGRNS
jgi:outer membrane protein assembly factor BamE